MDAVRYLTVDQVIEFHAEALREFGGLDGVRSPHQFSAYATIPRKAAAYGYFIAEAQAFIDGNKRTAGRAAQKVDQSPLEK